MSLLASCTAKAPSRELRITLPVLLWMLLSSLRLKDTVKVQKSSLNLAVLSLKMHGEIAQAHGNKHGFVHASIYEPSRALSMKEVPERDLSFFL